MRGINLRIFQDQRARRRRPRRPPLKFWKPSLTLDWKGGKGWHGQLSVRRTVAQLDFYDFISSAELSTDRINGGNPDLVPQQTWEFRGTIEHPLLGDGLAKLDVGYDLINDLQDRVLICDPLDPNACFDAPGNIGTGKRYFAHLTLDAPLAKLGLKGVRVKFDGQLQRTRVEDPINGEHAQFLGRFPRLELDRSTSAAMPATSPTALTSATATASPSSGPTSSTPISTAGPMAPPSSNIGRVPARRSRSISTMRSTPPASATGCCSTPTAGQPDPVIINEFRERNRHLNFGLTFKQTFGGADSGGVAPASLAPLKGAHALHYRRSNKWASLPSCRSTGPIRSTSTTS